MYAILECEYMWLSAFLEFFNSTLQSTGCDLNVDGRAGLTGNRVICQVPGNVFKAGVDVIWENFYPARNIRWSVTIIAKYLKNIGETCTGSLFL